MATNTWPMETQMLPPLVLRPPHGPRLARLLVMLLAVIFYLPPAGWSLITNGPEGELAGEAVALLPHGNWVPTGEVALLHGPLSLWLTRSSLSFFGISEFAARLPSAVAVVALLWLVLRMAERSGTLWRGCVAALMLLCSPGMLSLGRLLTPIPLSAALVAATMACLQRSVQDRTHRQRWLGATWVAWGLATLAGGWRIGLIPVGAVVILALAYPEARLRFVGVFSWVGALVIALTTGLMVASGFAPWNESAVPDLTTPWPKLIWSQALLLFPWSLLLLPAIGGLALRLWRLRRPAWEEALPLAWLAASIAVTASVPSAFYAFLCWPPFALWAAAPLNTLRRKPFLYGCLAVTGVACAGLYLAQHLRTILPVIFPTKAATLAAIPPFLWFAVTPLASLALIAFALLAASAFCAEYMQNRRFALLALFGAMIPAGFAMADIGAKFAPYFSDAQLTGSIENSTPRPLYVDASRYETSSLLFYLGDDARHRLQPVPPDLAARWKAPALLIAPRERFNQWKQTLPGRLSPGCEPGEHLPLEPNP
jgi:4-amino-4-deoxy-L-arabinose transferase-like glycosyltransferase